MKNRNKKDPLRPSKYGVGFIGIGKRLTQRKKLQPIEMRLIRQAMTIAQLQASLRNAYEKIDVQTLVIDKLERQAHHEPRF